MDGERRRIGSQTLARGLTALALIGESEQPLTVATLAAQLSIHRSMAYRLVDTLEAFGYVERAASGSLAVGARLAGIARNAARDLRGAAVPELQAAADELGITTFLVVHDGEAAVTIASAEPLRVGTTVRAHPGTRHPITQGAPGHVLFSQLHPEQRPPARYEVSGDEVFDGIRAVAVPLAVAGRRPAAVAALYLSSARVEIEQVAGRLEHAARRIADSLG